MDAQRVIDHIRRQRYSRSSFKHLARTLRVHGKQYASLSQTLKKLVCNGELTESRRGHYSLSGRDTEHITGNFSRHPDGYGFVTPDRPLANVEGDIFIPPNSTLQAIHHDRVVVRLVHIRNDRRAEGSIQSILDRKKTFVVGSFVFSENGSYVTPHDNHFHQHIQVSSDCSIVSPDRIGTAKHVAIETEADLDGWIVNAEITKFPTRSQPAQGKVIEILGQPEDFGVDVEIIIRKHRLPHHFSSRINAEVEQISRTVSTKESSVRRDFRNLDIVTIDGESARDFDDAVWVDCLDNGNFVLQVHIADVSHYVRPGTLLDKEARLRGTSVYFPDRSVPMLPDELSTDICSLNPQVDRLVVSVIMEITRQGNLVEVEFCRAVIRSVERMTYTNVYRILAGDPEQRERYQPLVARLQKMEKLATILNCRRRRRGSIDFDLPESVIEFDEQGIVQGIARAERNMAHRIIEEFMLITNEAVAQHLEHCAVPTLYRIHERPDPKRLTEFEHLLKSFGYSLGVDLYSQRLGNSKRHTYIDTTPNNISISPRNYQKLITKLDGKSEQRVLNLQMLRSLKQARYSDLNDGHFALATPAYVHFTSPIRRYPDLLVHRILTTLLSNERSDSKASPYNDSTRSPYQQSELAVLANETSFSERRAGGAQRELIDWKKARYMKDRLGEEFDAIVISVMRFGLFVELEKIFVEGLVPIESFTRERFIYRNNKKDIIGENTRRRFGIGTRMRVRADRISYDHMRTEFSWIHKN